MVLKGSGSKIELEEITACPECDSKHLIRDYNRGEMTCSGCGLVVDDNFIDQGPEWRAFDAEQNEKRSRGGAPMTVMVASLTVMVPLRPGLPPPLALSFPLSLDVRWKRGLHGPKCRKRH